MPSGLHEGWRVRIDVLALIDGSELKLESYDDSFAMLTAADGPQRDSQAKATHVITTNRDDLSEIVENGVLRAKGDIASMRLNQADTNEGSRVPAIGGISKNGPDPPCAPRCSEKPSKLVALWSAVVHAPRQAFS